MAQASPHDAESTAETHAVRDDTIYLMADDGPVEMRATLFDSEDDLQNLVARYAMWDVRRPDGG